MQRWACSWRGRPRRVENVDVDSAHLSLDDVFQNDGRLDVVMRAAAACVLRGIGDGAAVAAGRFTCVGCAVVETYLHTSVLAHRV